MYKTLPQRHIKTYGFYSQPQTRRIEHRRSTDMVTWLYVVATDGWGQKGKEIAPQRYKKLKRLSPTRTASSNRKGSKLAMCNALVCNVQLREFGLNNVLPRNWITKDVHPIRSLTVFCMGQGQIWFLKCTHSYSLPVLGAVRSCRQVGGKNCVWSYPWTTLSPNDCVVKCHISKESLAVIDHSIRLHRQNGESSVQTARAELLGTLATARSEDQTGEAARK
jgi:hypothetical protein